MKLPSILDVRQFLVEVAQLEVDDITYLIHSAEKMFETDAMRFWRPLVGRRCALVFSSPDAVSTYMSFALAAQFLGMSLVDFRATSVTQNGDQTYDMLLTIARNTDLLVLGIDDVGMCKGVANAIA